MFDRECPRDEAPELLALAAYDLALRLEIHADQLVTPLGSPDVKGTGGHLCRHHWRLKVGGKKPYVYHDPPTAGLEVHGCHTFGCRVLSSWSTVWHTCSIRCDLVWQFGVVLTTTRTPPGPGAVAIWLLSVRRAIPSGAAVWLVPCGHTLYCWCGSRG